MTFEEAIRDRYGIKIPITAADVKLRKFRIDQFRNGFLLKTGKAGVFGSFIDGETYIWNESGVRMYRQEHKESKEIDFEWMIWHAAKSMVARGLKLSPSDRDRLELAVNRLEAWL